MKTNTKQTSQNSSYGKLKAHLDEVLKIDGVASAFIWEPSPEEMEEMPVLRTQLVVEAYRTARGGNPSNVKADVSTAWLEQVSEGSGECGPSWAWQLAKS